MYRYLLFDNIVLTFFQVIRSVHSLMTRLMSQFPTEPTSSSVASKHEELDQLYAAVAKVVTDTRDFEFFNAGATLSPTYSLTSSFVAFDGTHLQYGTVSPSMSSNFVREKATITDT